MTIRVGKERSVSISNVKDKSAEVKLKQADKNGDGLITKNEAAKALGHKASSTWVEDVYQSAGGRQHDVRANQLDEAKIFAMIGTPPGGIDTTLGQSDIKGVGKAFVTVGSDARAALAPNQAIATRNVLLNLDSVDPAFLKKALKSATMLIGPEGFKPEAGSSLGEMAEVPMTIATKKGPTGLNWNRVAAQVDLSSLKSLQEPGKGLSFFIRLEMADGSTKYVNKGGQAFSNFDIHPDQLK